MLKKYYKTQGQRQAFSPFNSLDYIGAHFGTLLRCDMLLWWMLFTSYFFTFRTVLTLCMHLISSHFLCRGSMFWWTIIFLLILSRLVGLFRRSLSICRRCIDVYQDRSKISLASQARRIYQIHFHFHWHCSSHIRSEHIIIFQQSSIFKAPKRENRASFRAVWNVKLSSIWRGRCTSSLSPGADLKFNWFYKNSVWKS